MILARIVETLAWLLKPAPTVDPEDHYGLRLNVTTVEAPAATEQDLIR